MTEETVDLGPTRMAIARIGAPDANATELVWAHGWGQSSAAFAPMAHTLAREHPSLLLDLPGFGRSPMPPPDWGTRDYADGIAAWLGTLPPRKRIWIGHSFGCRVGLQLAAHHPQLVHGLVLIAAAGLRRRRTLAEQLRLKSRIYAFKIAKRFTPEGPARDRLHARFGSADSRNAGPLRGVFLRAVNEDLTETARLVSCPTLLIFGADDKDTPPEIGYRLQRLIRGSEIRILHHLDHLTVLDKGLQQVVHEIRKFTKANP